MLGYDEKRSMILKEAGGGGSRKGGIKLLGGKCPLRGERKIGSMLLPFMKCTYEECTKNNTQPRHNGVFELKKYIKYLAQK